MMILEEQLVQRAYDGVWERIAKVEDPDNSYRYKDEAGVETVLTPTKWITIATYPFVMERQHSDTAAIADIFKPVKRPKSKTKTN